MYCFTPSENMTVFALGQSLFPSFPVAVPKPQRFSNLISKVLTHFRDEMYVGQWCMGSNGRNSFK